jgi:hypothetical protein
MRKPTIKPFFGETRLERRFRLLSVASISLVIFVALWQVERLFEDSVRMATVRDARRLAESALLRHHWGAWEEDAARKEIVREFTRGFETKKYDWNVLTLEDSPLATKPANAAEERIVRDLQAGFQLQFQTNGNGMEEGRQTASEPIFFYLPVPSSGEIHYYEPVYWKSNCIRCHEELPEGKPVLSEGPLTPQRRVALPFRVVKVVIPDFETRQAIARDRALLMTLGIVTIFVATIASFVIFRLLVVRPFRRLREASNEMKGRNSESDGKGQASGDVGHFVDTVGRLVERLTEP